MIAVAVSLLPMLGLLLYGMDRCEDWLQGRPRATRYARRGHLRLVHSTSRPSADHDPAPHSPRHLDAA
ncbi:hypothetical protein ACFY1L_05380 [Streptomyces sp. NPDC001663]|uniref:hypothetical protein n=1 Tax=Streptomyces sp. NPDC001663 TaxID=3364597 RepID=UPI003679771F